MLGYFAKRGREHRNEKGSKLPRRLAVPIHTTSEERRFEDRPLGYNLPRWGYQQETETSGGEGTRR